MFDCDDKCFVVVFWMVDGYEIVVFRGEQFFRRETPAGPKTSNRAD